MVWHRMQLVLMNTVWPRLLTAHSRARAPPQLMLPPCVEVLRFGGDDQAHVSVLQPAKLGALAGKGPRLEANNDLGVGMAGDEVLLAHQIRQPEAVDDIIAR